MNRAAYTLDAAPVRILALASALVVLAVGCSSDTSSTGEPQGGPTDAGAGGSAATDGGARAPYALFIGIDGLRPDALQTASTPNLDRLVQSGASSFEAQTQLTGATSSGPGWASILFGVEVEKHGVIENANYDQRDMSYPSFLWRAKHEAGLSTALSAGWLHILSLAEDDATDWEYWGGDALVSAEMAGSLEQEDRQLSFIHYDNVDHEGHLTGYGVDRPAYLAAIETVDTQIGDLLDAIDARATRAQEDWLIVASTDHGGSGNGHGELIPEHRTIFFIVSDGEGESKTLGAASHLDVYPTILNHLGLPPVPSWQLDGVVQSD